METQTVINAAIGGFGVLIGAILKAIWDAVKDLQTSDKEIIKDVSELQVLVAGDYVKRDEFEKAVQALFAKLDKIESKLDSKANIADCPNRSH
jgi:glutathionyl-hydroquinone reductase